MADPRLPTVSSRVPAAFPPRWAFLKGFVVGAVISVPAHASGVWLLARLGVGDPAVSFMQLLRMTTLFAGVAGVLTAAGIGRLAAYASIEKRGGRRRAVWVAARAHAAASVGLVLIAAIPHGQLPDAGIGWLAYVGMGVAIGMACGAVLGVVCGSSAHVRIGDVMAAAIKRPSEALRQLLDPDDLIKLGAAVRHRTSQMFEGIFEPAERPPPDPGAPPEPSDATKPPRE